MEVSASAAKERHLLDATAADGDDTVWAVAHGGGLGTVLLALLVCPPVDGAAGGRGGRVIPAVCARGRARR